MSSKYADDFERVDDLLYKADFELWHIDGEKEKALGLINLAINLLEHIKRDVKTITE